MATAAHRARDRGASRDRGAYLFSCNFAFAIFGEVTLPFVSLLAHLNRIDPVGMSTVVGMAGYLAGTIG